MSLSQNQSEHFDQSEKTQKIQRTDQNSSRVDFIKAREQEERVRASHDCLHAFTSDWMKKWRDFFKPIAQQTDARPMQTRITFDSQEKTALNRFSKLLGKCSLQEIILPRIRANESGCGMVCVPWWSIAHS